MQEKKTEKIRLVSMPEFDGITERLSSAFLRTKTVPISEKNHICSVRFADGGDSFTVTYDTKDLGLTIHADEAVMLRVKKVLIGGKIETKEQSVQKQVQTPAAGVNRQNPEQVKPQQKTEQGKPQQKTEQGKPQQKKEQVKQQQKQEEGKKGKAIKDPSVKNAEKANPEKSKKSPPVEKKPAVTVAAEKKTDTPPKEPQKPCGAGFCLKKCDQSRYVSIKKAISDLSASIKYENTSGQGTKQEVMTTDFEDGKKQRVSLQYMVKSRTLQLQGRDSEFFRKAQMLLMESTDYQSAVQSYIDFKSESEPKEPEKEPEKIAETSKAVEKKKTKKKKTAVQIDGKLKKKLPYAYQYLSEQSKLLLTCAIVDIESKLSNYSGILVNAYASLEHLISELQREKGIKVKLIGQAYEKTGNYYRLKAAYSNKIGSVIFDEVMSAFYAEYYKRNFLAHSDNLSGVPRIVGEQKEAENMLSDLLSVMDYNCRKLSETGFAFAAVKK